MYKIASITTLLFFFFIVWIIFQADLGHQNIFLDITKAIPFGDKLGHVLLFGLLTLGTNIIFKNTKTRIGQLSIFKGTLLVTTIVFLEELSQFFSDSRTLDIYDLAADATGIFLFTIITHSIGKKINWS